MSSVKKYLIEQNKNTAYTFFFTIAVRDCINEFIGRPLRLDLFCLAKAFKCPNT